MNTSEPPTLKPTPIEDRAATGVEGLDSVIEGGIARGDLVLLVGHPGAGKTILSSQFLYTGAVTNREPGIYASFAENREAFLRNMGRSKMDFARLEEEGLFKFLDFVTVKEKGVEQVLEFILNEIDAMKVKRLVIDSFSALAQAFQEKIDSRIVLHTILGRMTRFSGVTTLLIAEKPLGTETLGGGMEEFVSDAVIILTHSMDKGHIGRNLDIVKMRGTRATRARLRYDITESGVIVYPPMTAYPTSKIYNEKVSTGIEGLDKMLGRGLYRGSTMLVMGESGTGKSTSALQFLVRGAVNREKTMFVSFEESSEELTRHGTSLGWKISDSIDSGLVRIVSLTPDPGNIDQIFAEIARNLEELKPSRLVVDSLTSLERTTSEDEFFQTIRRLVTRCKAEGMTCLATARTSEGSLPSDFWVSSLMDVILSLRQVESQSSLRRALVIFKARGLPLDSSIREFAIGQRGIVVEERFADLEQILSGSAKTSTKAEPLSDDLTGATDGRTGHTS